MNPENSLRLGWLRIGIPNETPVDQIDELIQEVAEYKLEGVVYTSGDFEEMGTIIEASLKTTGLKDLKPGEELTPEELELRNRIDEMFHDFEFDEF